MIFKILFILCCSFSIGHINAQDIRPEVKEAIEKRFYKLIKKHKVVGTSVAIIDNGKIVFAEGFGYEDREKGKKASAQTMYRVGSITKNFTAVAIMQLHEKGLLDINQSIKVYLPELTIKSGFGEQNILSIKNIMAHISGLPSDIMNGMMSENPPSIDWAIENLNKIVSSSPENYNMAYSNIGYGLLGELISRVSELSYNDYMKQNVFGPLEMTDSFCGIDSTKLAKAYVGNRLFTPERIRDYAAGSIASSVEEMANFVIMQLNAGDFKGDRILSSASMATINTDHVRNTTIPSSQSYGFGIDIAEIEVTTKSKDVSKAIMYNHGGDTRAFHANFGYIPELNVGAVILTNSQKGGRVRSMRKLLDFYLEETRGMNIRVNRSEKPEDKNSPAKLLTTEDVEGVYNSGSLLIDVADVEKFNIEIGKQKAVLKRKKGTNRYGLTAKIFGFIPMKIKSVEMEFTRKDGEILLSQNNLKDNSRMYFSKKESRNDEYGEWESKFGYYEAINVWETNIAFVDFKGAEIQLKNKNGLLTLILKSEKDIDEFIFSVHNNKIAMTQGIGRNSGQNLVVLDNGNLLFSGFELKIK